MKRLRGLALSAFALTLISAAPLAMAQQADPVIPGQFALVPGSPSAPPMMVDTVSGRSWAAEKTTQGWVWIRMPVQIFTKAPEGFLPRPLPLRQVPPVK
ncbi:MAG: hypothetical protein ACPGNT_00635 [Rhodospirillales bacterium]